ncbi:RNA polymerase sigma factor [Rhodopila sp.]|jgi:RNA polymerase sigma-70 factor (ECF subfamily)|uniref:RNA polymerase sigma factor n=1 Tax=Rhodopila sp. TaxID=2480087 RepID=UPI002C3092BC|nr:RNA polymerase sigma factor [Rhodopila sp.]HVZ08174.1 RNA polymerase sigma factor [Rhodopila sp.]
MPVSDALEDIYRRDGRKVFATLVRLLGGFDPAEEALHDAFRIAADRWPTEGVPRNPVAWLVSAGRFRAIDRMRRERRLVSLDDAVDAVEAEPDPAALPGEQDGLEDDQLRLIFTCCHPSLAEEARIALTLREVCGLATEAIARAVLVTQSALAQRIVRAKAKIRDARIPYHVPDADELPERLPSVLRVIYLIFNEGYAPSSGERATNPTLSREAIRLARLLRTLLPEPEVAGLLGLMLLQESRRMAREAAAGAFISLEEQDRTLWDRAAIAEGQALVEQALRSGRIGSYTLQAAIAAVHGDARSWADTDWTQIVGLYDALLRLEPSPVIALNRAVAVAMRDGAVTGLALIDELMRLPELAQYVPGHAARADLCRRAARYDEARDAYRKALALSDQQPAIRYFQQQLDRLPVPGG